MQRYSKEANRLYGVMDAPRREQFIACDEYNHRDMPSCRGCASPDRQAWTLPDYPHVKNGSTHRRTAAVQRGLAVLADLRKPVMDARRKR